jgi:hypothetical protein
MPLNIGAVSKQNALHYFVVYCGLDSEISLQSHNSMPSGMPLT